MLVAEQHMQAEVRGFAVGWLVADELQVGSCLCEAGQCCVQPIPYPTLNPKSI